jgi:hypothetical protein
MGQRGSLNHLVENHAYRHGEGQGVLPLLMFSAAGNVEAHFDRPSAGRNNTSLGLLLQLVHAEARELFPSPRADDYPMLNAWPKIESKVLTRRTEASLAEVVSAVNLARVQEYVAGRRIVAFGARARRACEAAGLEWVATSRHLSFSGLNRIKTPGLSGAIATAARVRLVADELLASVHSERLAPSSSVGSG